MSLARLWQQQGKRHEAHERLSAIYDWFTEGFDTKDLQEAKALLNALSQERGPERAQLDQALSTIQELGMDEVANQVLTIKSTSPNLRLAVVNKGELMLQKPRIQRREPRVQGKRHK